MNKLKQQQRFLVKNIYSANSIDVFTIFKWKKEELVIHYNKCE